LSAAAIKARIVLVHIQLALLVRQGHFGPLLGVLRHLLQRQKGECKAFLGSWGWEGGQSIWIGQCYPARNALLRGRRAVGEVELEVGAAILGVAHIDLDQLVPDRLVRVVVDHTLVR
jgi:hypothetical protein